MGEKLSRVDSRRILKKLEFINSGGVERHGKLEILNVRLSYKH